MKYMILDPRVNKKIVQKAQRLGYCVVFAPIIKDIDSSVSGHPDMQLVQVGKEVIVNPNSFGYFKERLKGVELVCGKTAVQGKYPEYTAYNVALCGNYAIHNFKYTDKTVAEKLKNYGKINVKQGYTKCSVITTPYGVITADKGISKSLKDTPVRVVEIQNGEIELIGKENGFPGGASGYDDGVLFFSGDITTHPDYKKIKQFCDENGIKIVCLSNDKPVDIGSIVTIRQTIQNQFK